MMGWLYLLLAIVLEVAVTTALKVSEGLTKLWPAVAMFALYGLSFAVFSLALKRIDLSVGYAIWPGCRRYHSHQRAGVPRTAGLAGPDHRRRGRPQPGRRGPLTPAAPTACQAPPTRASTTSAR